MEVMPEIDWYKGSSDILLSSEMSEKLALEAANQLLHVNRECRS